MLPPSRRSATGAPRSRRRKMDPRQNRRTAAEGDPAGGDTGGGPPAARSPRSRRGRKPQGSKKTPSLIFGGLSALVVLIAAIVIGRSYLRGADKPTDDAKAQVQVEVNIPDEVRRLYTERFNPAGGDAGARYAELVTFAGANRSKLRSGPGGDAEAIDRVVSLLLAGAKQSGGQEGFLDAVVDIEPGYKQTVEHVEPALLAAAAQIQKRLDRGETKQAADLAAAVVAFGDRAFRHNATFAAKTFGLKIISRGAGELSRMASGVEGVDPAAAAAAYKAARETQSQWTAKANAGAGGPGQPGVLATTKPYVGDLLLMAEEDAERAFRIQAVANLGYVVHDPGHVGNKRAIDNLLDELEGSDDKLIVAAVKAARQHKGKGE